MSAKAQKQALERQQQEKEKERKFQQEQQRLQEAFNQNGNLSKGWMREILSTEGLEQHLNEYELDKVRALINKQWMLANLSKAQTHDRWFKLEVMKYKIIGSFPPQESAMQGKARAFFMDDKTEQLYAMTAEKRNAAEQIIMTLQNMVTRSTDGFERKQVNTNIARTETEHDGEKQKQGALRGLFS